MAEGRVDSGEKNNGTKQIHCSNNIFNQKHQQKSNKETIESLFLRTEGVAPSSKSIGIKSLLLYDPAPLI